MNFYALACLERNEPMHELEVPSMTTRVLTTLPFVLLIAACAATPQPPPNTPAATTPAPATAQAKPSENPNRSNVVISEDIRKACGLTDSEAFFGYDSASVREQDKAILKKLAECFARGPLKGRQMRLVGHADPRGDQDYNYLLGQRRADSVRSAIVGAGLSGTSVTTTSRGENDASGADASGWAKDRRVDVLLGS